MAQWDNMTIDKVWFDDDNIYIRTNDGTEKSHPLRWFDRLWNATPEQRERYVTGPFGDDIHWPDLDEDLSLEGFFTYSTEDVKNQTNKVADAFRRFPAINISKFAESLPINRSLLASYICNEKKPGARRKKQIEEALHKLGKELLEVKLQ